MRALYGAATLAMLLVATYWAWLRSGINPLADDIRPGGLSSSSPLNLLQTWLGYPLMIDWAPIWRDHSVFTNLLPFGLLTLFLLTLGRRAALFGLGLLPVASHIPAKYHVASGRPFGDLSALTVVGQVPWWAVLILADVMSYPLFLRLVLVLAPFDRDPWGLPWLVAGGLIVVDLGLPQLPAQGVLVAGGCLLVIGIGWLIVEGLGKIEPIMSMADWAHRRPWLFVAALVGIGLETV